MLCCLFRWITYVINQKKNDNKIYIDQYLNLSSSGRYLNYLSHHSHKIKINLVLAFILRVERISHPTLLRKNIIRLRTILLHNSYVLEIINKFEKQFRCCRRASQLTPGFPLSLVLVWVTFLVVPSLIIDLNNSLVPRYQKLSYLLVPCP